MSDDINRRGMKLRYDRRRAAGICTRCGRCAAAPSRSICRPCADRHNAAHRVRNVSAHRPRVKTLSLPLTELPQPSKPLNGGGIKRDYLVQGWCPPKGSIALGMIWNGK